MRRKILLLVIVSIVFVLVSLGLISYLIIHDSIRHSLEGHLALASILSRNIDSTLDRNLARLHDLSLSGAVDLNDGDWAPEKRALRTAYEYSIFSEGVYLLDRDGNVVLNYPHKNHGFINMLGVPYIERALREGRTIVSDVYTLAPTGRQVIFAIVPVKDTSGGLAGLAVGEINPVTYQFASRIRALAGEEHSRIDLIDSHGIIISSNDPGRVLSFTDHDKYLGTLIDSKKPLVGQCHRCHEEGGGRSRREAEMLAMSPLEYAPWGVAVRTSERLVFEPATKLQKAFLIIGFIIVAASVVLAMGLSRSIINPLRSLARAAGRISKGDLARPVRVSASRDELGSLSRDFEYMRRRLAESLDSIQRHNEELELRVRERTEELDRRKVQLASLVEEVMSAQEEERKRIARELHDESSQTLAALGMSLEIASIALSEGRLTPEMILDQRKKVDALVDGINRLIHDLRPPVLDELGFESAVRWLIERNLGEREAGRGIRYLLNTEGLGSARLSGHAELSFFRVIQEAVANIARHSQASNMTLTLRADGKAIEAEIWDDGVGFDFEEVLNAHERGSEHGFGILGMRERVEHLDGHLGIESSPGRGTRLRIVIPLGHKADQQQVGV